MPNRLSEFIDTEAVQLAGLKISFARFVDAFRSWLPPVERPAWTRAAIVKTLDDLGIQRGVAGNGRVFLGNLDLKSERPTLQRSGNRLVRR
ncbi:MAG: hypothetical protein WD063_08555 [Pirellulales bacterium]